MFDPVLLTVKVLILLGSYACLLHSNFMQSCIRLLVLIRAASLQLSVEMSSGKLGVLRYQVLVYIYLFAFKHVPVVRMISQFNETPSLANKASPLGMSLSLLLFVLALCPLSAVAPKLDCAFISSSNFFRSFACVAVIYLE
jgi:anaerobic C4-dicarboxylate transporter